MTIGQTLRTIPAAALIALLCLMNSGAALAAVPGANFDHLTTGFELTGAHRVVPCESCHVDAIFHGTPRRCESCHVIGSRISATAKPADHVVSANDCGRCHTTSAWSPSLRYDHSDVTGSCESCHNGTNAGQELRSTSRRPRVAIPATARGVDRRPLRSQRRGGNVRDCHNGMHATGKPVPRDHERVAIPATTHRASGPTVRPQRGDAGTARAAITARARPAKRRTTFRRRRAATTCHNTTAFAGARFNHSTVARGTCATCHNGSIATGKPSNHIPTTATCDTCHNTTAFVAAQFDHAECDRARARVATTALRRPARPATTSDDGELRHVPHHDGFRRRRASTTAG